MFPRTFFPPASFVPPYFATGAGVWLGDFTESGIVNPRISIDGTDIRIAWDIDPAIVNQYVFYQIYIDGQLKWTGDTTAATVPGLPAGRDVLVHVGRVLPANRDVNYSYMFDHLGNRARLRWLGGRWIDDDLEGFNIYMSQGPGLPVSMLRPAAQVPAAVGGVWADGFGRGPFGRGPFGHGNVTYQWISPPLRPGAWQFAVASVDSQGNLSPASETVTIEIVGPPSAPPPRADGKRIWIESYDPVTRIARVRWNAST